MFDNQIDEFALLPDDFTGEVEAEEVEAEEVEEAETEEVNLEEETETVEETTEADEVEVIESLEDLKVKFLKEEKSLKDFDRNELQALIQKGLNSDRLEGKLQKQQETITKYDEVAEMAQLYGYDAPEQLLNAMRDQHFQSEAERTGASVDVLKENYQLKKSKPKSNDLEQFVSTFPDVKETDIPSEVWEARRDGGSMVEAYGKYLESQKVEGYLSKIAELEKQLKTQTQNVKTKSKAVVKPQTGDSGTEEVLDDFLTGLLK